VNRRGFFKVAFAAGLATALPALSIETLPTIYGDGIHDDTDGLQAALDGKDFHCRDKSVTVTDGNVRISNGNYLVSRTLVVPNSDRELCIEGCRFEVDHPGYWVKFDSASDIQSVDFHIGVNA
jgi:hypothetical protein